MRRGRNFFDKRLVIGCELLEPRLLLTADAQITSAYLQDDNGTQIQNPIVGERVEPHVFWTVNNSTAGDQYIVRFTMDGVAVDSTTITDGMGSNLHYNRLISNGWYDAPNVTHTMTITIDPNNVLQDPTPQNNTVSFTFTSVAPTTLPEKLIWPLPGVQSQTWSIINYVDVNPTPQHNDFNGGIFTYDGHQGMDITVPNFSKMDAGLQEIAAAPGTVTAVTDGNFDRNKAMGNQPVNHIQIDLGNGWQLIYYHLMENSITVKVGDTVTAGQVLGLVGSSGSSTLAHLHFEVRHNGDVVETNYDPNDYWQNPLPYQGTLPTQVMDSGMTSVSPVPYLSAEERPPSVATRPASGSELMYFWYDTSNTHAGDAYVVNWYRPNGTLAFSSPYSPTHDSQSATPYWDYYTNWANNPGTWHVTVTDNGIQLASQSFTVAGSTAPPIISVAAGDSAVYVPNGRTTPFDFGSTPRGTPVQETFTVSNLGYSDLTISGLNMPPGFSLVGRLPAPIPTAGSSTITVQMSASSAGSEFGQLQFLTNDPTTPTYGVNISGTVTGAPPAGAPVIGNLGPAVSYTVLRPPQALNSQATLTDSDSTSYAGGSLKVEFASGGTATDILSILNQGAAAGQIGVSGNVVAYGGTPIGSFTGGSNAAPLLISFNSSATIPAVQALLHSIAYSNSSANPSTAPRYVRLTIVDDQGNTSNQPIRLVVVDTVPAPTVTNVLVGSTQWTPTFLADLASQGLGTGGYQIPVGGAAQSKPLPWSRLNQISVTFSQNVQIDSNDLTIDGVSAVTYGVSQFNYNPATFTAQWTLAKDLSPGATTIALDGHSEVGVRNAAGMPLDGEWTNSASSYPSGNGTPGADFDFAFNDLPTDGNQDGIINAQDLELIATHWLSTDSVLVDTNGDGLVNSQEIAALASNWLHIIPLGSGQMATIASDSSIAAAGTAANVATTASIGARINSGPANSPGKVPTAPLEGTAELSLAAPSSPDSTLQLSVAAALGRQVPGDGSRAALGQSAALDNVPTPKQQPQHPATVAPESDVIERSDSTLDDQLLDTLAASWPRRVA